MITVGFLIVNWIQDSNRVSTIPIKICAITKTISFRRFLDCFFGQRMIIICNITVALAKNSLR